MPKFENMMQDDLFAGPGKLLQKTRQAQGLALEEVAKKLYLTRHRIIEMENDNYSKISLAYAKGYLKSYAKLLGIQEREILTKFNNLNLTPPKEQYAYTDVVTRSNKQIAKQRHYIRGLNIVIAIILIILVSLWWHGGSYSAKLKNFGSIMKQVIIPSYQQ